MATSKVLSEAIGAGFLSGNSSGTILGNTVSFADSTQISTAASLGMRNRIINGGMTIDQRYAGGNTSWANSAGYMIDRMFGGGTFNGTLTSQIVSDAPIGFSNSLKITVTSSSTYSNASDYQRVGQIIEGYNISDLYQGTSSPSTVTASFWVKSSLSGTFGGYFSSGIEDSMYIFQYTINSTNTWEKKTITIPGSIAGTWSSTNGYGARLMFSLGCGPNRITSTPNTWISSYAQQATGNISIGTNVGATWQITGLQLEKGTTATPFEYRQYGTELALCQRYYECCYDIGGVPGTTTLDSSTSAFGLAMTTSILNCFIMYQVQKRAPPSATTIYAYNGTINKVSNYESNNLIGTAVTQRRGSQKGISQLTDSGSGFTVGTWYWFGWAANAEL